MKQNTFKGIKYHEKKVLATYISHTQNSNFHTEKDCEVQLPTMWRQLFYTSYMLDMWQKGQI